MTKLTALRCKECKAWDPLVHVFEFSPPPRPGQRASPDSPAVRILRDLGICRNGDSEHCGHCIIGQHSSPATCYQRR